MQYNANILAQKLPNIDDLVDMARVISKKSLHEFLPTKFKEQNIEFTKRFKRKGNTPPPKPPPTRPLKVILTMRERKTGTLTSRRDNLGDNKAFKT